MALYRVDRFAEMLDVARQGLDIDPQRAKLHHYAAHALSVRGMAAEVMIHSREAVRLTPADPINQIQLACLELSGGNFRKGWARHNIFYTTPLARATRVFRTFRYGTANRLRDAGSYSLASRDEATRFS